MKKNYYLGEVVEDEDGELAIQLPIDMLNQMGWDEGTLLEWIVEEEGKSYALKEVKDASGC